MKASGVSAPGATEVTLLDLPEPPQRHRPGTHRGRGRRRGASALFVLQTGHVSNGGA